MKKEVFYVPVKKILAIINSCQNDHQLEKSKKIVDDYVKSMSKHGVINTEVLRTRLYDEIEQREEALYLVKLLN